MLAPLVLPPLVLAADAPASPIMQPTRDVDVIYEMARGLHQRMRWDIGQHRLRVDPPSPGLYLVVDLTRHRAFLVQQSAKRVLESPATTAIAGTPPTAATPHGTDTVAGLACTEWKSADNGGNPTLLCVTPDGVMLRARTPEGSVLLQAVSVEYAPQDPSIFAIPTDFSRDRPEPAR